MTTSPWKLTFSNAVQLEILAIIIFSENVLQAAVILNIGWFNIGWFNIGDLKSSLTASIIYGKIDNIRSVVIY